MADSKDIPVSKALVAINSASSLGAKVINVTVLLWMYQYLLKRIPAEEFAVLPVVTALMVFAPLFFSFFTGGIARYVVEAYAKRDFDRVTGIVSSIFPPLAAMALAFLAGGMVFAFNIEKVLNIAPQMVGEARVMMALLIANFAVRMLAVPLGTGFHVRQRFVELNLLGIGRDLIRIFLLLVFLLGIGAQVIWVVMATVIAETVYTGVMVWRSCAMVPELRISRRLFRWGQAWELMNFGIWTTLGRLGSVMYTHAATIVLNLTGSATDVTSYHLGSTFYRQLDTTIALAAQPLQPVVTTLHAREERERLGQTVFRGGRIALWVSLGAATPLVIYAQEFIALYLGGAYSQAAVVITLFMLIFPFTKPTMLLAMTAMAMARVRAFFLPAFLFQLAGLILMVAIANFADLGAVGVTLSLTLVAFASQVFYYWPLCLRLTGLGVGDFISDVLRPGVLPALAGGAVWLGLKFAVAPASWGALFLCGVLGGLVYLATLLAFCLAPKDKEDLRAVLARTPLAR